MSIRKSIRNQYLKFLDREPELDDLDFYCTELESGRITLDDLILIIKNSDEYHKLPKSKIYENDSFEIVTYNDIRIKGKTLSSGYRNSEERYNEIYKFCKKFN
ncbi:MAG: DUF4214 domain-containing protein, partial [Nitrosopumilus sp.]|nr:DUF4214 domain-containing protein [Nitrosopumilus sp.]